MSKVPAFQFYTGDWLKDPELQACNASTRGIWINLIACMWEAKPRGEIRGTLAQITRLGNANSKQMSLFISEVGITNFADVENTNGIYIIRNRRMIRDEKQREYERERKREQRSVPPDVPEMSLECPDAPSSSSSDIYKEEKEKREEYTPEFEEFWSTYPRKIEKFSAFRKWNARLKQGVDPADLIAAATHYAEAKNGTDPEYIKHPATFLGPQRPYEEWIAGIPVLEQPKEDLPEIPLGTDGKNLERVDGQWMEHDLWEALYRSDLLIAVPGGWKRKEPRGEGGDAGNLEIQLTDGSFVTRKEFNDLQTNHELVHTLKGWKRKETEA